MVQPQRGWVVTVERCVKGVPVMNIHQTSSLQPQCLMSIHWCTPLTVNFSTGTIWWWAASCLQLINRVRGMPLHMVQLFPWLKPYGASPTRLIIHELSRQDPRSGGAQPTPHDLELVYLKVLYSFVIFAEPSIRLQMINRSTFKT